MDSKKLNPVAMRLAIAIKRLKARLRQVSIISSSGLPMTQLSILRHLRIEGPTTASTLAAAEHISQQAIAQNIAALKRAGLVQANPDPTDGRKSLISMTRAGHSLFESGIASRNAWLAHAIESKISPKERPALEKAIELLERLADADSPRENT
jgi:DNA-binding MarR family transcriptional regulator